MAAKQGAEIIVEKLFKEEENDISYEKQPQPRLYLELLENKEKVIPEIRQIEYEEKVDEIELTTNEKPSEIRESIVPIQSPLESEVQLNESVLPISIVASPLPLLPASDVALPPKLADIVPAYRKEATPVSHTKPVDGKTLEKKQRLLLKLDILKKSSKATKIPNFSLSSDYSEMKSSYKSLVKRVHVDNKVEWLRNVLVGACGALELGLGDMGVGLDMEGFTEFQMASMSKYDKLLIKIGEKSYKPKTVNTWPVEVQLLFLVFVQTLLFIGAKFLKEKTGANILGFFQAMSSNKKSDNLTMPK
jgi:hypothetical protein